MATMLLGYAGAIAVGASITLLVLGLSRRRAHIPLLADLAHHHADLRAQRLAKPLPIRLLGGWAQGLAHAGRRFGLRRNADQLHLRLDRAGFGAPAEMFHAAKAVGAGLGLLIGLAATLAVRPGGLWSVAVPLALCAAGASAPALYLSHATQRRASLITLALPESLDLLALTVQAGLGLEQAIAEVADEVPGPLGEEFERLLKEQQLGRSRHDSLEALRNRTTSDDLARLVGSLLHAEQLGSPIAVTLQTQATELRRRRRARARERAGKAPVKLLFPLVFCVLPAMFVIIIGPGILRIIDVFAQ